MHYQNKFKKCKYQAWSIRDYV